MTESKKANEELTAKEGYELKRYMQSCRPSTADFPSLKYDTIRYVNLFTRTKIRAEALNQRRGEDQHEVKEKLKRGKQF
jgi:ribose 1,5-bisphosphokinase PhnN